MTNPSKWRLVLLVAAVACAGLLGACAWGNRHLDVPADEFLRLAAAPIGSAYDTRFLGATRKRAYLSVWSAMPSSLGGGEDVCSCELDELPADISARIRAGENPWAK